jgi:hypothetical protein
MKLRSMRKSKKTMRKYKKNMRKSRKNMRRVLYGGQSVSVVSKGTSLENPVFKI